MIPFIDLTRQHAALRAELLAVATRVLDSSQFVLGAEGKALEQELAALCGVRWRSASPPARTRCAWP